MPLSRFLKGLVISLALFAAPVAAFAQVSAIRSGVNSAAGAARLTQTNCTGTTCVIDIISRVVTVAVQFSGVLLLCYFLYAGFLWMTASGEPKNVQEAQSMIKNAIIGLVLITVSFAIANFVLDQLSNVLSGPQSGGGAAQTAGDSGTPSTGGTQTAPEPYRPGGPGGQQTGRPASENTDNIDRSF